MHIYIYLSLWFLICWYALQHLDRFCARNRTGLDSPVILDAFLISTEALQDLGVRLDQVPSFAKGLEEHGELPFWMCPVRWGNPVWWYDQWRGKTFFGGACHWHFFSGVVAGEQPLWLGCVAPFRGCLHHLLLMSSDSRFMQFWSFKQQRVPNHPHLQGFPCLMWPTLWMLLALEQCPAAA